MRRSVHLALFPVACILAAVVAVRWQIRLIEYVPAISRGDFLWEIWHIAPAIEGERYGEVLALIFKIFGGHIVVYTRLLQVINYIFFDYSGEFVRWSGIVSYGLACLGVAWYTWRGLQGGVVGALTLVVGMLLLCSPIAFEVIGWADAMVPYLSSLIILLLLGPWAMSLACKSGPLRLVDWLKLGLFSVLVLIGSGVGWAIFPALAFAIFVGRGHLDAFLEKVNPARWLAVFLGITVVIVALYCAAVWVTDAYAAQWHLDDVNRALLKLGQNPSFVARYFLTILVQPINVSPISIGSMVGGAALSLWLLTVVIAVKMGRLRYLALPLLLSLFGLGSALLVALGRWEIAASRGVTVVPSYYSLFSLPFFLGLIPLILDAIRIPHLNLRGRLALGAVTTAALVFGGISYAEAVKKTNGGIAEYHEWHLKARDGARDWNLVDVIRLSGASEFAQQYLLGLMAEMKRLGKYAALTEGFINDPQQFAHAQGIPQPLELRGLPDLGSSRTCNSEMTDGAVFESGPDTRNQWYFYEEPVPFAHFSGYARNRANCDAKVDYVIAVDRYGKIACVSRTAYPRWWDLPTKHRESPLARTPFIFDFSCPLFAADGSYEQRAPFTLIVMTGKNLSRLAAEKVDAN